MTLFFAHGLTRPQRRRDATADLKGHDARFFCLGVSSVGMTETAHHHVTYELTLRAV